MAKINVPNASKYESPNRNGSKGTYSRKVSSAGGTIGKNYPKVIGVAVGVGLAGLLLFGGWGAILGGGVGWYIGTKIK